MARKKKRSSRKRSHAGKCMRVKTKYGPREICFNKKHRISSNRPLSGGR